MKRFLVAAFFLACSIASVAAQPINLPPNSIDGRLAIGTGPEQGIPLPNLLASITANNSIWAGSNTFNPASGDAIIINPAAASTAKGFNITQTSPECAIGVR